MNVVQTTAPAGTAVTVQFVVNSNATATAAGNAVVRYSADVTCTTSDTFVKNVAFSSIAANGNSGVLSTSATVPAGATAGTRYMCVTFSTIVGTPTVGGGAGDNSLTVTTAAGTTIGPSNNTAVTPTSVAQGGSVTMTYQLVVTGAGSVSSANATIRLSSDDAICENTDPFIKYVAYSANTLAFAGPFTAAGSPYLYSTSATIPAATPAGVSNRYLCVFAGTTSDDSNAFTVTSSTPTVEPEQASIVLPSSPSNDDGDDNFVLEVAQGGSMEVDYLLDVTIPVPGGSVPAGNATIRLDTNGTCENSDTFVKYVPYNADPPGAALTADTWVYGEPLTLPAGAPLGSNRSLCVWAGGAWSMSEPFSVVAASPDVWPLNINLFGPESTGLPGVIDDNPDPQIKPATMIYGDTLTVTFDVYNSGNKTSNAADAALRFHIDDPESPTPCSTGDAFIKYVTIPQIPRDQTYSVETTVVNIPAGVPQNLPHKICVTVDNNNAAGQLAADKANDTDSELVVVGALPDLVPVNISVTPDGPIGYLSFDINNQGRGPSTQSHVRAFLSDLDYEHDFDDFETYPGNVEIDLFDPCALIDAKTNQVMGMGENPSCTPALASGDSQHYSAEIPLSSDFGSWSGWASSGTVSPLLGGGVDVNIGPYSYGVATFSPGRYVWIVADSEKTEGVGEAGQTLAVLHENDEQMLWANPWTVGSISSLSFDFANVVSAPVDSGSGYIGNANPVVGLDTPNGDILAFFDGTSLATESGCNGVLTDPTGRWDDWYWGGWFDGASNSTWSDIQTRRGGEPVDEINIYFNYFYNYDDGYDLDVTAVNLNETCI